MSAIPSSPRRLTVALIGLHDGGVIVGIEPAFIGGRSVAFRFRKPTA